MAPIAAVVVALGAGATGLATSSPQLAAAGAVTGAAGVALSEAANRAARRRHRDERSTMRSQLRDLEAAVAQLSRKLDGVSAVLQPETMSLPIAAPAPQVTAVSSDALVAGPLTPHALPILTANRRGLQSCAADLPGLPVTAAGSLAVPVTTPDVAPAAARIDQAASVEEADEAVPGAQALPVEEPVPAIVAGLGVSDLGALGLPGQRPPATPISGLALPMLTSPSLPRLSPGPSDRLGSDRIGSDRLEVVTRTGSLDLAMIAAGAGRSDAAGAQVAVKTAAPQSIRTSERSSIVSSSRDSSVIDLRATPDVIEVRERTTSRRRVRFVTAEFREAARTSAVPRPSRDSDTCGEPLFSPRNWPGASGLPAEEWGRPSGVAADSAELRRLASAGRTAQRGMRSTVPASPFFTPGAFDAESQGF